MIKFFKKLYRKIEVRHRKKDNDEEVNKVIQVKDYGDYHIEIIYMNDYINKKFINNEDLKYLIEPYIVFFINFSLDNKDIIDDYYNKLLPFLKTIRYVNHIDTIKDNKIYCYIGLYGVSIKDILKIYYPDGKDISFILSNIISLFNDYCNNEFCKDIIPLDLLNEVDKLPYTTPIRSFNLTDNNILYIDKIPNINEVFTVEQILYMTNIVIYREDWVNKISESIYVSMEYPCIKLLRAILNNEDNMYKCKDILYQLENDSYFTICGTNLLKYSQHCKSIKYNIFSDSNYLYDEIDEVIDDETDSTVSSFISSIDDNNTIDEY